MYFLYLSMKLKKWKALVFMYISVGLNFISLGFMFYDDSQYRYVMLPLCTIGGFAFVYVAVRTYRKNRT
jgi:hypothetical protein